jgi:two-component system NarL family response regulator
VIHVLVVDDHQMVAQMRATILEREADIAVVGTAGSLTSATALAASEQPNVVLLDFHLPDGEGGRGVTALLDAVPSAAIVMLSADESEAALQAAVAAGAAGFLLKSWALEQVPDAIRRAAAGEMLIPAVTLANLLIQAREAAKRESERVRAQELLSAREQEVLELLATGIDTPTIAEELGISLATVRWHVQHVLEKLDAHSKLEAVVRAGQLGLLPT